jgi:flavin reductase (DIM6/NTAB) family NADH-FMN oxidoreductase RutF
MQGQRVFGAATGAPILEIAVSWLDCEVRHTLALGSHSWFVGEVLDCGEVAADPSAESAPSENEDGVLRTEDTRMNYGG